MQHISQVTAGIPRRAYTTEEVEAARRKVAAQNTICSIDCPICGGIGFVQTGDGQHVTPCPNVDPLKLYPGEKYGLSEEERGWDWDIVEELNNALQGMYAVQRAMARGAGWVYLWGPPGLAKTLIIKIAVAESLRSRRAAAYTRMAEILDDMRGAFDARDPSAEGQRRLDWWADLPLLAIDEFDRVRSTEYASERRFLLMDKRYEQALRGKSITLLTSNEDPAKLEGYLYDRIRDGRFEIVRLTGDSARPGMEW
jgi:hypothetical protein